MSRRAQLAFAAMGFVMPVLALVGLFGGRALPPPAAHHTAAWFFDHYQHNVTLRRAGLYVGMFGMSLIAPIVVVIGLQLRRIDGARPGWTWLQLIAGCGTFIFTQLPMMILIVASYRPGRSPEITQSLNDLGYVLFLTDVPPFVLQNLAIAFAVLGDRGDRRVYPRWVGYFNLWVGASFVPATLIGLFKFGPFAVHGLFSFWVPTFIYGLWSMVMGYATWQTIKHDPNAKTSRPDRAATPDPTHPDMETPHA